MYFKLFPVFREFLKMQLFMSQEPGSLELEIHPELLPKLSNCELDFCDFCEK